jgi:CubicO group peptidase (beta-lactamase class C family)
MHILKLCFIISLCFILPMNAQENYFENHLANLLPQLIKQNGIAGIAVGVIENGEIRFKKTMGFADKEKKTPVSDNSVFNVASISKTMTAWGIMHLAKTRNINLDEPANNYLTEWKISSDTIDVEKITIRSLLSHTSGLSLSAVPEYNSDSTLPSLDHFLKTSDELFFEYMPQTRWNYSGGGYMILQKVIEDVTNTKFEVYMENEILIPLGLKNSKFYWDADLLKKAATPYHDKEPTEYFNFVGSAAASLNSSLTDLLRWLSVTMDLTDSITSDTSIINYNLFREMITPARATKRQYGLRYGLGYDLWPIEDDIFLTGHNGQNTGWTCGLWFNPISKDGLIVLINDSRGYNSWRWIFCDWMYWTSKITWQGICTGRPENLPSIELSRNELKDR